MSSINSNRIRSRQMHKSFTFLRQPNGAVPGGENFHDFAGDVRTGQSLCESINLLQLDSVIGFSSPGNLPSNPKSVIWSFYSSGCALHLNLSRAEGRLSQRSPVETIVRDHPLRTCRINQKARYMRWTREEAPC